MTGGPATPFRVVYSGLVKQAIRRLGQQAYAAGRGREVVAALQAIDAQLHSDPRSFGEAMFQYHWLNLEYRAGIKPPLFVQFTVHLTHPVVFVKKIAFLPRHGF